MARPKKKAFPLKEQFYKNIEPLTYHQELTFQEFRTGNNLMLLGYPGTGKTFLAMFLGFEALYDPDSPYRKMIIVRNAKPTHDMGHLPGTLEEKLEPYKEPYVNICDELFKTKKVFEDLEQKGGLMFRSASYLRGLTFDDAIVVVDECQNLTLHQLETIITRAGTNTRMIFCGDFEQSDFTREKDRQGLVEFAKIIDQMIEFRRIDFNVVEDIVRSGLARDYILTKINRNEGNNR